MTISRPLARRAFLVCNLFAAALAPRVGHADTEHKSDGSVTPPDSAAAASGINPSLPPPVDPPVHPEAADTPVDVVCKAAVALALAEPERARGFLNRARVAGWLPEVRFRVYRRFARTEGLTFDDTGTGAVAPVDVSAIDDVRYEWRATWDLSRMVFNPDELQAHFEALRMSDVRRDIQSLVIKLYFERRRLVIERFPSGSVTTSGATTDARAADRRTLRIWEIEAQLDALSDGAFSGGAGPRREGEAQRKGTTPPW